MNKSSKKLVTHSLTKFNINTYALLKIPRKKFRRKVNGNDVLWGGVGWGRLMVGEGTPWWCDGAGSVEWCIPL